MYNSSSTVRAASTWRGADVASLLVLGLLFFGALYCYQLRLPGAFVFGDQTEYAGMTHSLLNGQQMKGYRQYGPLYPAMIAAFQTVMPAVSMFRAALVINLVVSLAALIPFYRLCRRLLTPGWVSAACALTLVLAPFWAFTTVTWADPLFYSLFFFSLYSAFDIEPQDGWHRYVGLGILLGLLFLAKPIGLFYVVAMLMSLVIGRRGWPDARAMAQLLAVLLGSALCILPWVYRNIAIEHTSALGYSYVGTMFKEMLGSAGWARMIGLFLAAIGFHLAYIICSALGAASIIPVMAIRHWRALPDGERVLICYVVSSLAAVSTVSAVHMFVNPYLGYWVPNGRYLTQYVPVLFLLAAALWQKTEQSRPGNSAIWGLLACGISALIVYFCTPLESMATFSIFNNPEMAAYFLLLDGRNITWRAHFDPTELQRLIPLLAALLLSASFFFLRQRRAVITICIVVSLLYMGVTSWHQSRLIRLMAWSQKPVNELFWSQSDDRRQTELCMPDGLYFDKPLEDRNINFIRGFWCPGSPTRFATPIEACQQQAELVDVSKQEDKSVLFVSSTGVSIPNSRPVPYGNSNFAISRLACTGD